jgi:hypothetical protein
MLDSASERRTQCRNACNTSVRGADRGGGRGSRVPDAVIVQARAARRANNLIILNNTAEGSSIYTTMHDHSPTLRGSPSRCGSPLPGSDAVMDITDRDHDVSIMP